MLQSTYGPKPGEIAKPAGISVLLDLIRATPIYLFVTSAKAALESANRR